MERHSKIYVAGHKGMVGSAIVRSLNKNGYTNIIGRTSNELDLMRQEDVEKFFEEEKPDYVFLAAAKVGGIYANNTYPAEFIYNNLMIETNVVHSAYLYKTKKLLFLGSSCIYPKMALQPIKEEYFLSGTLESTNEAYAIAKISGMELCKFYRMQYGCDFISAMPTNLYGINDNFDLETSHVVPALIRKFHEAKINGNDEVVIWGTGKQKREFLYVDDLADACIYLINNYSDGIHINVGTGEDVELSKLVAIIKNMVGYEGNVIYDLSKPDGTPRKVLDITRLTNIGWKYTTNLSDGLKFVYDWYRNEY